MPKRKRFDPNSKSASSGSSKHTDDLNSDEEENEILEQIGNNIDGTTAGGGTELDEEEEEEEEEEEGDSVLKPLDPDLIPIMNKLSEINVDQLEGDESNKINLNRVYIDVQLLRLITPSLQQKAMTYGVRRRNNNNQYVIFSRLMLCRVYSNKRYFDGSRLIYLMESKNSNQCLFNKNIELRDNGVISIGTFFRIVTPLPIENKMRGDIPLVKTHLPLIVMMRPSLKESIPIKKEIGNQNSLAFVLVGTTININRSTPIKTTCGGLLCDKQRCSDWNGTRGCGCYHFRDDISNIAFEHSVFF